MVLQYGGEWEEGCGEGRAGVGGGGGGGRGVGGAGGWGGGGGDAYYAPVAISDHSAKGIMVRVSVIASQGRRSHWVGGGGGGGGG